MLPPFTGDDVTCLVNFRSTAQVRQQESTDAFPATTSDALAMPSGRPSAEPTCTPSSTRRRSTSARRNSVGRWTLPVATAASLPSAASCCTRCRRHAIWQQYGSSSLHGDQVIHGVENSGGRRTRAQHRPARRASSVHEFRCSEVRSGLDRPDDRFFALDHYAA